ncbi:MAG: hypothetical protein AB8H86_20245 [Polyangiales bacterium]
MRFTYSALLALLLAVSGCVHHVPIETLSISRDALRLGETDFSSLLRAAGSLRFAGSATLKEGRFAMPGGDYAAVDITGPTTLTFEADVALRFDESDENVRLHPEARTFALSFSRPVVLIGNADTPRRVTLESVRLEEGGDGVAVNIRAGRTIAQSIAQAISGVPAGIDELPDAVDMFRRIEVGEVRVGLRDGAEINHAGSVLKLGPGSALSMRRVDVDVSAQSARLDLDAHFVLAEGTCIAGGGGRLCVDSGELEARGTYSRRREGSASVGRLTLTTVDRPSQLVLGAGRYFHGDDGDNGEQGENADSVALTSARLELTRYECGGPVGGESECVRSLRGDMVLGEGSIAVGEHQVRFDSVTVERATFGQETRETPAAEDASAAADGPASDDVDDNEAATEETIASSALALREMRFEGAEIGDEGTTLRFEHLSIRDVHGDSWDSLSAASGEVVAQNGRLAVDIGGAHVEGSLSGETRISLSDSRGTYALNAVLDGVEVRAGEGHTVRAPSLVVEARAANGEGHLELRAPGDVQVQSAGEVAIDDLRLQFRSMRVERRAGTLRFATEGLRLSLPEEEVLALLGPQLPPAIFGEEQDFDAATQAVMQSTSGVLMARDLSRFRARLDTAGFGGWELGFNRGRLRARGSLALRLVILADEREVDLGVCHHEVSETVSLPCFEDGLPGFCEQTVQGRVPYPCLEENQSLAELMNTTVIVDIDVTEGIESNAPTLLSDLELSGSVERCDRFQVRGIPASLQRAIDLRGTICDRLQAEPQTVALRDVAPAITASPLLAGARIETLRFDSDGERIHLDLDVSIEIPDPTAPVVLEAD